MRRDAPVLYALKVATVSLALVALAIGVGAVLRVRHAARLVSPADTSSTPPTVLHIDAEHLLRGFSAPADTHIIFTVPSGVRIPRITLLGGADYDQRDRYWGYCFDGHEEENKRAGKRGLDIYTGRFFYSRAELNAQLAERRVERGPTDLVSMLKSDQSQDALDASKASQIEIFTGGETCYLMSSVPLPVALDSDGDDLNDERESILKTDPHRADTDGDGATDGQEVFIMYTSPTATDTDEDGLPDTCEDKNHNGQVDPGETSPLTPDTDRDQLCDGNGFGARCPERRLISHGESHVCDANPRSPYCLRSPIPPVHGEDMNQNCSYDPGETDPTNPETFGIADWQFKWNVFQASLRR